jgi:tRNA threonylcarbamoyladenosine modification (KEOPS) complex  Pcc1 subunit
MKLEGANITITLDFSDEKLAEIIWNALEPENSQINDKSNIQMKLEKQRLVVEFSSQSSLSTIRNTVDDIISTVTTSENIYKTVKRNE